MDDGSFKHTIWALVALAFAAILALFSVGCSGPDVEPDDRSLTASEWCAVGFIECQLEQHEEGVEPRDCFEEHDACCASTDEGRCSS